MLIGSVSTAEFRKCRLCVTGGSGFLGQHLVRELQRDETVAEIRVLDIKKYHCRLECDQRVAVCSFVADVRDAEACRLAFRGAGVVFHCAALVDYSFPPDYDALHQHNVKGTETVVRLCVEERVPRLVLASTAEVCLTPYLGAGAGLSFSLLVNQTESRAAAPAVGDLPGPDAERGLLAPGYAASKLRAERLVLAADGTPLPSGGVLRTVAVRPTLLYGELDPHLLPPLLRVARACDGRLPLLAGAGGRQQVTYVGNAAWALVCAARALASPQPAVLSAAGLPLFATDDTPPVDLLRFCARVTARPDGRLRVRVTSLYLPAPLAYLLAAALEGALSLLQLRAPVSPRAAVAYLNSVVLFSRLRAALCTKYEPKYSAADALARANKWYTRDKL
ncbi:3 beta-hydroxysteroid dehydrogenase/Delta 5--_4-isomerase type 1 [Schistocerca piceifrons]|uniref:3 beta-hydroxysteroid dehydrogenase/Delta 5-->4-isomerase type 1 n=1 Tax=Schistocerca piceifrons TaxID=274613 RepID=UPI001F5F897D|nr:3 beta-hydroxysteroid dehydrogenase/Delta 5-->4-isomerase type 1 [Schistocerca piceifrons]